MVTMFELHRVTSRAAGRAPRTLGLVVLLAMLAACDRSEPADAEAQPAVSRPARGAALSDGGTQPVAPVPVPAPEPVAPAPAPGADQQTGVVHEGRILVEDLVARLRPITSGSSHPGSTAWLDDAMGRDRDEIVSALYAVAGEPTSAPARYVLACALAREDMHELAKRELESLRASGCPACLDALQNIPGDETCGFAPEVASIVDGVAPSPVRVAAETIMASFNSGDVASAKPYLDPARPASIDRACSVCDIEPITKTRQTRAELIDFIRKAEEREAAGPYTYNPPLSLFCHEGCCRGPTGPLRHTQYFVSSICFRGDRTPKLQSMYIIDGG